MGYCGICNTHYDGSYEDHDFDCPGHEVYHPNPNGSIEDRFAYEKQQQGWPDDMDEEMWDKHFRFE